MKFTFPASNGKWMSAFGILNDEFTHTSEHSPMQTVNRTISNELQKQASKSQELQKQASKSQGYMDGIGK